MTAARALLVDQPMKACDRDRLPVREAAELSVRAEALKQSVMKAVSAMKVQIEKMAAIEIEIHWSERPVVGTTADALWPPAVRCEPVAPSAPARWTRALWRAERHFRDLPCPAKP